MISFEQIQKDRICNYWNKRSKRFAQLRSEEYESTLSSLWIAEITKHLPLSKGLNILDVGTGTGYFALLLAKYKHHIIGIDLSNEMIEKAKHLSTTKNVNINFEIMDAENLLFADESFDVVISRNLTWNLIYPEKAYQQWTRVLKKGGILLNFDADYSKESFSADCILPKEHAHHQIDKQLLLEWEDINKSLPLNGKVRPKWDKSVLEKIGCAEVNIDPSISDRIYTKIDRFYNPVPMFLIKAIK